MRRPLAAGAALLLLASGCGGVAGDRGETYGFVAVLGNDTTSVERVTRTGSRVVSDAVGRSPRVVRRHWEAELGPDGTVEKWSLDTYVPNAPAAEQRIHYTADFSGRAISLSRGTPAASRSWSYQKQFATTVPWNAFVYGTYELLLDAARLHPNATRTGLYFFEGWDAGHLGIAAVQRQSDGSYSVQSTGLAGTGVARVDSSGRMVSYSGEGTTYKQEVRRIVDKLPDIDSLTTRFAAEERRAGVASELSVRDTVRATVGGDTLTIDYGRPLRRGRVLVGGLIPYDQVWRTGANAATQLTTSGPIELAGTRLEAGTYTLWTLPTRHGPQLIINGETGQWGTEYSPKFDLARRPMSVDSLAANVERFTFQIDQDSTRKGAAILAMEWGNFRWAVAVRAP
jgi:hypothetical protein